MTPLPAARSRSVLPYAGRRILQGSGGNVNDGIKFGPNAGELTSEKPAKISHCYSVPAVPFQFNARWSLSTCTARVGINPPGGGILMVLVTSVDPSLDSTCSVTVDTPAGTVRVWVKV